MSDGPDNDDRMAELEQRIRDAEVARGERDPVPADPTDLPLPMDEYYWRSVEHGEPSKPDYPHAHDRWVALAEADAEGGSPRPRGPSGP